MNNEIILHKNQQQFDEIINDYEIDKRVGIKPFWEVREIIEDAYNELELSQKENIRLKKQLSKDHHVECSCSFCKPLSCSYVENNFIFTNCNDCKNKIDGIFQEVCSNCKRFYGCYFEKKSLEHEEEDKGLFNE